MSSQSTNSGWTHRFGSALEWMFCLQPAVSFSQSQSGESCRGLDGGGGFSTSISYEQVCCIGMIGDVSHIASPLPALIRLGFLGQIIDVSHLAVSPQDASVYESSSIRSIAEWRTADDELMVVAPGELTWFALGGPVAGVSYSGIAATISVYQKTSAFVTASDRRFIEFYTLRVMNSN